MSLHPSRREFLRRAAVAGSAATFTAWTRRGLARDVSPNEKLNIGVIGTANRARGNIEGVKGEDIVALCDIDDRFLGKASEMFPRAKTYNDFRKLLEQPDLDAVVISTADHTHVPAAVAAMDLGKHVYCEKPLGHDVYEVRVATERAARAKVATQMGTQIHAGENYRRVVELIQAGAIGPVREVHCWVPTKWAGGERPTETPPVPPTLHWDLWLGPAPERPYHPTYLPISWRRWWAFGSGTLGDMGCHYLDLPFWALGLTAPTRVEAEGPPVNPETAPEWVIARYEFPARGDAPPVKLTWYDGGKRPECLGKDGLPDRPNGILFVGEKGLLLADYNMHKLYPEDTFKDFEPPARTIPPSIGHHAEWIRACKTGEPTTCRFAYSGPLAEAVLLGTVAYRVGQPLEWDSANLRATNCPDAERYLRREYRKGWSL